MPEDRRARYNSCRDKELWSLPVIERQLKNMHDDLSDAIANVADGDPVLLRHGTEAVGALVSVADLQLLERYWEELENRIDLEAIRDAKAEIARSGTVPWEAVKESLRDGIE